MVRNNGLEQIPAVQKTTTSKKLEKKVTVEKPKVAIVEKTPISNFTVSDIEHDDSERMYGKEYSDKKEGPYLCYVPQGGIRVFDGRPMISDGFTRCNALIVESPRASVMLHIDPDGINHNQSRVLKKYFSGLDPVKAIMVKGPIAYRSSDCWHDLDELKIECLSKEIIDIQQDSKYRWGIIYNEEKGKIFTTRRTNDEGVAVAEYDSPSIYSQEKNNASQELFESRDYMPPGFRLMEKYFKDKNFRLGEYSLWDRQTDVENDYKNERGFDLGPGEKLYVWNARDGIVELDLSKGDTFADLLFDNWLPPINLLVARTLLDSNFKDEMTDGKIGSVIFAVIEDWKLYLAYSDQGRVTRDETIKLREENKKYINVRK